MVDENFEYTSKKGSTLEKLVEVLFKRARFPVVIRDKRIPDGTGTDAQIDVYVETEEGQKIFIECKHKEIERDRINKEVFEKVDSRIRRLGADRGLIITDASVSDRFAEFEKFNVYFWDSNDFLTAQSKAEKALVGYIYEKLNLSSEKSNGNNLVNTLKSRLPFSLKTAAIISLILLVCLTVLFYMYQVQIVKIIRTILGLIVIALIITLNKKINPRSRRRKGSSSKKKPSKSA